MRQNITIADEKTSDMSNDVTRRERELEDFRIYVVNNNETMKTCQENLEALKSQAITRFINNKNVSNNFKDKVKELRNEDQQRLKGTLNDSIANHTYYAREIPLREKALAIQSKKLDVARKTHPDRKLNINDIKIILSEFPNVDEDRCRFNLIQGVPHLLIYVHDIRCTPNKQKYINMIDDNWLLPAMEINFNLLSGQCRVRVDPELFPRVSLPKAWATGKPHPHIMRHDAPCYGDFLGAVVDAKEDLDISQMVTIMLLFLEQCYPADDAGSYYPRFMMYAAENHQNVDWYSKFNSSRRYVKGSMEFYGYAGTGIARKYRGEAVYFIPVVENGVVEVHEVDYHSNRSIVDFLNDLKLPKEERTIAVLPENVVVKEVVKGRKVIKKRAATRRVAPKAPEAILAPVRDDYTAVEPVMRYVDDVDDGIGF